MKKKFFICVITIFLILILSGCTEMTRTEKNLCISLSSKSYAYIPVCETENSCFEKVSLLFKTKLGYEEESILYEIKNHVARSWYFYNKSLKEQKTIQTYCQKGDAINAAGSLNQAQELMTESFSELDQGMKKSFELINIKEKELTKEEIDLIKEEAIYTNLVTLRQIISELSNGATNSDTYVSYYSKKAQEFAKSSASKGFPLLVEKTPFWIENFGLINNSILDALGIEKESSFAFAEELLENLIEQAEFAFYKKQSLLALQKFPIYEFMKLYSDLGGNNNSALKRFSDLINNLSQNQLNLNKKLEEEWLLNEKNSISINELLKTEKESEKFEPLANKIMKQTITTDTNIIQKAKNAQLRFIELKEKKYSSTLTKGKELEELKEIEINFNEIINSLLFKITGFKEKLIEQCKLEASEKIDIKTTENKEITELLEEVTYFSSRVKNTLGTECLLLCEELIAKKDLLDKSIKSTLFLQAEKKDLSKDCIFFLEKIFTTQQLFELKEKFEELKKTQITTENLNEFEENCKTIKLQVENELKSNMEYIDLKTQYTLLKENLIELEEIAFYINEKELFTLTDKYNIQKDTFEEYFYNSEPLLEKIIGINETLLEKITLLNKEIIQTIEKKTIYYIEKNIEIVKLNSQPIELNKSNYSNMRLIINNPFKEINKEIYLKINFDINQMDKKDPCVNSILPKTIKLFYLPTGKTTIDYFEETLFSSKEKNSFIYSSNEISLLKREIEIVPKISTQKLLVKTNQPQNTINTIVLINSTETLFANENGETKFVVEKLEPTTKIEIFYYLTNILKVTKELIETKTTNIDETLIYKITAQNTLPLKLTSNIIITLPSTNAEINTYSADYTKKETKKINNKLIIPNQDFLEKETKYFEIWVKTSSALDYYKEGLEKQESFFIEHNYLEKAKNTKKIREGENLESMKRLFESNSEEITKIEFEEKNKSSLELMKQKLLEKIEELRQKQNELYNLGLTLEAEKIGTTLDSIISEKLDSEKEISIAFDKLVTLYFSAENKLKSEVEKMWETITTKSEKNAKLTTLKNTFFEKKQLFDEQFSFDMKSANKTFVELQKDYSFFLDMSKEIDKNNLQKEKELIKKLNEDLNYCKTTLSLIEKDLIENNSALIKAKFIVPLTQSRIDKIKFLLAEIENSNLTAEEKIKKIEPLKTEIWEANELIKKQAVLEFNKAVDNKTPTKLLQEGKSLLDQNNYISAYLLLSNNSTPKQTLIGFSYFLPILLIIIAAFVVNNKIRKNNKDTNEKKKKIMEEWDKL